MLRKILLATLLLYPYAANADVEPGSWELSVTSQMPGMAQPIGPIVQTQCMTPEDARDPSRVLKPGAGSCEFSNRRDSGGVLTFDVSCSGQFPMRGSGSVRYGRQSLDAELELVADAGGQKIATKSRVTGRWLGPCQ